MFREGQSHQRAWETYFVRMLLNTFHYMEHWLFSRRRHFRRRSAPKLVWRD